MRWLCDRGGRDKQVQQQSSSDEFSTRGFLAGRFRLKDLFKLPRKEASYGFAPYVAPVTITQVGRASASATLDHVVSSSFDTTSMAANQIITSIFYRMVPLADSLSLTAQSFVPGIAAQESGQEKKRALTELNKNFLKAAMLCGAVLSGTMARMPIGCRTFTSDPALLRAVHSDSLSHQCDAWSLLRIRRNPSG
jgi:Na+-driven multidrug efflux pump